MKPHTQGVLVAVLLIAGACNGLPKPIRQRASALPVRIDSMAADVAGRRERYRAFTQSDSFAFFAPYAEREHWTSSFDAADRLVAEARKAYEDRVAPLLEENRMELLEPMTRALITVERALHEAQTTAREPAARRAFLVSARDQAPALVAKAETQAIAADSLVRGVEPVARLMKERYPRRATDIDSLVQRVIAVDRSADSALVVARRQLAVHENGGSADYAALGDGVAKVGVALERLRKDAPALIATLRQLDRSYTRILADMRVDYWVQVGRSSWDNCCDGSAYESTIAFPPRQVPPETYREIIDGGWLAGGAIARYSMGWRGPRLELRLPEEHWNRLGVAPGASWKQGHDAAELWIEDAYPRTYHRYLVIENGDTATTDWVEVDEDDFIEHQADLGMAILSKPYGYFDSEAIEEAAPPGLTYVGNPRYGEWREASTGGRFWHWYGQYVFLSYLMGGPGYRYRYDDWLGWNRDYRGRRPYYGPDVNRPTYGTWGSRTGTGGRFAGTTFARRGGFRSQDISLRGAGPAARARGPGGGGK